MRAFESLCDSLKKRNSGRKINIQLFHDLDFTLDQAKVLAWLMNHKDTVCSLHQMSRELRLQCPPLKQILNNLFARGFLEKKGDTLDVSEELYCQIIDIQVLKQCGKPIVSLDSLVFEISFPGVEGDDDEI